jgi:hypothetical protein
MGRGDWTYGKEEEHVDFLGFPFPVCAVEIYEVFGRSVQETRF